MTCATRAEIGKLIDDVEGACGGIEVLVNNAGAITVGPAHTMTAGDFGEAMNLNFWAAVHTSLALIPRMRARGFGRIVNVGSVGGKMPVPHLAAYSASKFALVGFSGAMRTELCRHGILVTNVNPGLMRTGSPRNANFKGDRKAEYAWFGVADALPGLSMEAGRAARRIVDAAVHGEAEAVIGLPARIGSTVYGLMPNLYLEAASVVARTLPEADDGDSGRWKGRESESWITRSFLRHFGRRAEREYNQLQA